MITSTHRTTSAQAAPVNILSRAKAIVTWPFTNRYTSPLWLVLRLYIGWIFLQFGWRKVETGWLTGDPMGTVIKQIADGKLPVSFAPFRDFCAFLVNAELTPLLSFSMPFMELAVALALFSGILVVPAAIGASILLVNFMLSGIGTLAFEGRIMVGLILLMLAYRVVSVIGFERLALRILVAAAQRLRIPLPRRALQAVQK
jgi:thiosulfate dehydrogenase (quinone) large subunit